MGLDSLMMVELKNRIEKEAFISLSTVELMVGPSIRELSKVLLDQFTGVVEPSARRTPGQTETRRIAEDQGGARDELTRSI